MIKALFQFIFLTVLVSASTPARCGPLFGNQKCPCVGSGKPWDMNTYCDEVKGECGRYRSSYDASSGLYDCETNVVETLPTGCLKIENGNFAGIYKVNGLHAGKNRYVHTTDPSKVISWVHIGRYAWHITQNGQGIMHWYHDRDAYGINIGFDGNPAAGVIPGIPDLTGFPEIVSDYESQAEGCMPAVTRPTKPSLISAGKSATSSALYNGAGRWWPASNALRDSSNLGQLQYDCRWHHPGSVAIHGAPAGTTLWWQVDLGKSFEVTSIKLRGFNLPGYWSNGQFKVCSDAAGLDCTLCGGVIADHEAANTWKQVTCNTLVGRYVRLTHRTIDRRNWHFCRVEVYGRETTTTQAPSLTPTQTPTSAPSLSPTQTPTSAPSLTPTQTPTSAPSLTPTETPTSAPSLTPTQTPTSAPSLTPTETPTSAPSLTPTETPTSAPSLTPTKSPSPAPTAQEFTMKVKGFHGDPVSSLARIVFSQERTEVEKIVSDVKTIKAAKDTTRKN